jgi:type IV pilus assembly protein PilM
VLSSPLTIIDCGASRTALGIFDRSGGRLRLENGAIERFPVQENAEDNWLRRTAAALPVLRSRVPSVGRVILVLPPHLTLTKHIRTPRVSAAKREKIVRFEAAQAIPHGLAEVVWDTTVAHEGASDSELLLTAVKLEAVNALVAAAESAGFEPALILPATA